MSEQEDIVARLDDLIVQATKERSHYYVRSVAEAARDEINRLRGAIIQMAMDRNRGHFS